MLFFLTIILLGSLYCGMINGRNQIIKFFLCYELFYLLFIITFIFSSFNLNDYILVFYFFYNPTFEIILGLSVFFISFYLN